MAVNKWIWVGAGVGVLVLVLVVGLVGFGVYFVAHHLHTEPSSRAAAQEEFDQLRARCAGRPPLIELGDEAAPIVHRESLRGDRVELEALDVLAWEPQHRRLVRVSIPFWAVRLSPDRLNISGAELPVDFRRAQVTAEDLERYGPGVILDFEHPDGARVLAVTR